MIKRIWKKIKVIPNNVWGFLQKDFALLFRKKKYLYLSILLPILIGLIYLFTLNGSANIKVLVCDYDNTAFTQGDLFHENFDITRQINDDCLEEMKVLVKKREYLFGIVIPKGFSESLENLQQVSLDVYYDNSDPSITGFTSWKVDVALGPLKQRVITKLADELKSKSHDARESSSIAVSLSKNLGNSKLKRSILSIDHDLARLEALDTYFLINPIVTDNNGVHKPTKLIDLGLAPLFVVLNLFLLLMLCSTGVIYDRKNGLFSRIKSSNSSMFNYLVAKLLFFLLVTIVQFLILLLLFLIFGARYNINFGILFFGLLFIGLLNTLIGFLVGLISESEGVSVLISLIITLPMMFLSSMFFPLEIMPKFVQWSSKILPLHTELFFIKSGLLFGGNINWYYLFIPFTLFLISWWFAKK